MTEQPITERDVDEAARYLRSHKITIGLGPDPDVERVMTSEAY
jgi:hypothetical protein